MCKKITNWIINNSIVNIIILFIQTLRQYKCINKHKKAIIEVDTLPEGPEKERKKWARELYYLFVAEYNLIDKLGACFLLITISPAFITLLLSFVKWYKSVEFIISLLSGVGLISVLKLIMNTIQVNNKAFNFQIIATKDVTEGLTSFYDALKHIDFLYNRIKDIHNNLKKF